MTLGLIEYNSTVPLFSNRGLSDEAQQIYRIGNDDNFANSFYTANRRSLIANGINNAINESMAYDQDGYEAFVSNPSIYYYAMEFLNYLPFSIPFPEIAIDRDGEIAFDWDYGQRKLISVRVGKDGTLTYAWKDGLSYSHGEETLKDNIPDTIMLGIKRVIHSSAR